MSEEGVSGNGQSRHSRGIDCKSCGTWYEGTFRIDCPECGDVPSWYSEGPCFPDDDHVPAPSPPAPAVGQAAQPLLPPPFTVPGAESERWDRVRQQIAAHAAQGGMRRIKTGIVPLDDVIGGVEPGLSALVGPPGARKTGIICNSALRCHRNGHHVVFVQLELSDEVSFARLVSVRHSVPWLEVLDGQHLDLCDQLAAELASGRFYYYGPHEPRDIDAIVARVRLIATTSGVTPVVYVDHAGLVEVPGERDPRARMTKVAAALAWQLGDLGITIFVVFPTARANYQIAGLAQALGAAKESGDIEYAATNLIVLPLAPDGRGIVYAAKRRFGAPLEIPVRVDPTTGNFARDTSPPSAKRSADRREKDRLRAIVDELQAGPARSRHDLFERCRRKGAKQDFYALVDELVAEGALEADRGPNGPVNIRLPANSIWQPVPDGRTDEPSPSPSEHPAGADPGDKAREPTTSTATSPSPAPDAEEGGDPGTSPVSPHTSGGGRTDHP